MEGKGAVIGKKAPDFALPDQNGGNMPLAAILAKGPALLVFYPGDFTVVCTRQLCNYRDNMEEFSKFGVQVVGLSANSVAEHALFAKKYEFPFPLLSDIGNKVAKSYGCSSWMMLGGQSRAVFIVNAKGIVLYRYVEPTALTARSANELVGIIQDLRTNKLL